MEFQARIVEQQNRFVADVVEERGIKREVPLEAIAAVGGRDALCVVPVAYAHGEPLLFDAKVDSICSLCPELIESAADGATVVVLVRFALCRIAGRGKLSDFWH